MEFIMELLALVVGEFSPQFHCASKLTTKATGKLIGGQEGTWPVSAKWLRFLVISATFDSTNIWLTGWILEWHQQWDRKRERERNWFLKNYRSPTSYLWAGNSKFLFSKFEPPTPRQLVFFPLTNYLRFRPCVQTSKVDFEAKEERELEQTDSRTNKQANQTNRVTDG